MSKESKTSQSDFKKLSSKDWWDKIDIDLKGKSRERLYRPIVEELKTKPFYHFDDDKSNNRSFQYQKRDSTFLSNEPWLLGQKFFIAEGNEKETASLVRDSIDGDSQYIELVFENDFQIEPFLNVLENFKGKLILSSDNSNDLEKAVKKFSSHLDISIIADPDYMSLLINGKINLDLVDGSAIIPLNSNLLINKGASEIQEGVYILACLNQVIHLSLEKNIKAKFLLRLNTGSNFFLQIAKFRSLRMMANFIINEWGLNSELLIEAQSSKWNKSVYDRFTNILRLSSESFATIVGGTDILNISGFEESLKIENSFTHRNARNISHLLRYESHLDKVSDHAAGSYFVENLCQDYSRLVWEGFQEIESKGGLIKYTSSNDIEVQLEKSKILNRDFFGDGKIKMVGTNTFPNPLDELTRENIKDRASERLAYNFEELRAQVDLRSLEDKGKRPCATLLKLGATEMRFARASFATNFLECAGIKITESDKISEELEESEYAVLCSSDEAYLENGVNWAREIKTKYPKIKLIVAGNPENKEMLKKSGVDFFIHLRTPLEKTLTEILKSIGIEKA